MFTFAYMMDFRCARLVFVTHLFSFSRYFMWHDFFGHEEYLFYRNNERSFEVGTKIFPDLFNAPHAYLILIILPLSDERPGF